tara:strand:- start:971 stop:1252 length:282 start_codon:yes stop_codon:yes gene_type:complete
MITALVLTAIPRRYVSPERRQRGTLQTIVLLEHAQQQQQQQQQQQPPRRVLVLVLMNGCLVLGRLPRKLAAAAAAEVPVIVKNLLHLVRMMVK